MAGATLFVGRRIYTGRRYAQALLVEDGRVVAVGPEPTVRPVAATGTERVDLAGGLLVPGLADAHLHLGEIARARAGFDASAVRSVPELGRRLSRWVVDHPQGPVVGHGLDPEALAEHRWPTLEELDAIVPDRLLAIIHASGHAAAANSAALERLRGRSHAHEGGGASSPSAVVVEEEADALQALVGKEHPLTPQALSCTAQALARLGLTAIGTMNPGADELLALRHLDDAGQLPIRVRAYPSVDQAAARGPSADARSMFAVVGVKAFLDGAFGTRTASLREPYADAPGTRGVDRGNDAELSASLEAAQAQGLTPALHAIGDQAIDRAIRLLAERTAGRTRIEHAGLTPPRLLEPLRRLGAWLVVQPGFVLSDTWLRDRLGPARARWAYAFRSLSDRGVPLAGSSDAPYDLVDPWRGIRAAVDRRDELGRSANPSPDQAISDREAFALYTRAAYRALGIENGGELEPGAPADLVVLSARGLVDALGNGSPVVRETWVAGRRVGSPVPEPGQRA